MTEPENVPEYVEDAYGHVRDLERDTLDDEAFDSPDDRPAPDLRSHDPRSDD